MPNTIRVKFDRHFKIHVPVRGVTSFENELSQKGIAYYTDKRKGLHFNESVLFCILDKYSAVVHQILSDKHYVLDSEVLSANVFSEERKMVNLYLKFALLFIILTMVLKVVGAFVNP